MVISRNDTPGARLVQVCDGQGVSSGAWLSEPGWEMFEYDPSALAPISTDGELAQEGWPI